MVLEEVGKVYGEDIVAVTELNLDISDGEFIVFCRTFGVW